MSGTTDGDGKPKGENDEDNLDVVDEESEESFPASDPPSHTPVSGTMKPSKKPAS